MPVRILWAIVGGFLAGVFVRSLLPLGLASVGFVMLLSATAAVFSLFDRSKIRVLLVIAAALTAFSAGVVRVESIALRDDPQLTARIGSHVTITGVVANEPDVREASVRIHMEVMQLLTGTSTSLSTTAVPAVGVLVVAPVHTNVAYGDTVRAEGELELPESFDTSEGRQFNYPMFLAKDGILYTLSFAQIESTGGNRGNIVQSAAIRVKQEFLKGLQAVLPEPEAGLAGGITVGDKRSIGKELTNTFITVSLIHVVVLSGYNITILINAVRRTLQSLPRLFQYGGIAFSVLFIVLMTGGAPSATRAAAMSLIAVFARATARTFIALRILGVVAAAMVAWNPLYLVYDPGFQLSVLATLGLILFTPRIAERTQWITERFGLREIVASTLSTQLMVLPLLLYQNGLFSIVSLPANLFALIAVPYAMFASIIAAIGGMAAGSLALPIAAPALALLWYIINVAKFFASLPFAALSVPAFSAWWMFAAYALIFGALLIAQKRESGS